MPWIPNPGVTQPAPPTVQELVAQWVPQAEGPEGIRMEEGPTSPTGMPVVNFVFRNRAGEPVGILHFRMLDGTPEIVDIAVLPRYQRLGIGWALVTFAKKHGFDLRDVGSIYDGPLTDEGKNFRDKAIERGTEIYGPASWEETND